MTDQDPKAPVAITPIAPEAAAPAPAVKARKPAEPVAKEETITATLVRGKDYSVNAGGGYKKFLKGVPTPVSAAVKALLERDAVDTITVEGEAVEMAKFKFSV